MHDDRSALSAEIGVGASYASLMSATALFFTGILISQYRSFNPTIRVPLIYLIISTFSFIFAATIYSNAGAELTLNKVRAVEKYMIYAKNIVELLGLYLFILAVPMVIGAVTQDSFLRTTTIIIAVAGFGIYSQSRFSVLDKELSRQRKRYLSIAIIAFALLLYLTQPNAAHHSLFLYSCISIVLLLIITAATVLFSLRSKQYRPIMVRAFKDDDARQLSAIILKTNKVPGVGIPLVADKSYREVTPETVRALAEREQVYVAKYDKHLVGLTSLKSDVITTIFTDPTVRRKGVGRALVERLEGRAADAGFKDIKAYATTFEHSFYKRLGYEDVKETKNEAGEKVMLMQKELYQGLT
jgi:GNAT superfamily N-acetyltransferase